MHKTILILALAWLISACAAEPATIDPSIVQTAIAQTAAANPSATSTPEPTDTLIPSGTPTPTATPTDTATPTATFTHTPTASPTLDLRVIDGDPRDFLLSAEDLPDEAWYYLPNELWMTPNRNSEIISAWGREEGQAYLETTGRVDGWLVIFLRGSTTFLSPEQVFDNAVLYRTIEGAQLVIDQYSPCKDAESGYSLEDTEVQVGDISLVCVKREMQPNGQCRIWYRMEFVYRNYYHAVVGYGWEREVRPEFIEAVGLTLLNKLITAPMTEGVTFAP